MNNKNKRIIGLAEIFLLILSTFAFAYMLSPFTEASEIIPSGCCLEAKDGSICQNMVLSDADLCKDNLAGTSCDYIDACRKGCCFNPSEGLCSLNSPKDKCIETGGEWFTDRTCNIDQCLLGCCLLGEEAAVSTSRQCTKLSNEFNFEKQFVPLDEFGGCDSYAGLSSKGACVTDAGDYSGLNDCIFTTKRDCVGKFYENFLCTHPDLNTTCVKKQNTTCVEGDDQIHYIDSCGNIANIYDASRYDDETYWMTVISRTESCTPAGPDCGNCDYMEGSRCFAYDSSLGDEPPTFGENVCRDLSCDNGRKHGESWCIYDYNTEVLASSPVGSRSFKATCFNGEITIEGCADFNQETCREITDTSYGTEEGGFTEARCKVNEWRNCYDANNKGTYEEIEKECSKYEECIMFLDIPGNEIYEGLPGFKRDVDNSLQGSAGQVGKDANKIMMHCVPKSTPGMVFWTESSKDEESESNLNYGGSKEETEALCNLGNFVCVSNKKKANQASDWKDKENPECNIDAESISNKQKVPLLMEALNERCRALGPCGSYINIAGSTGSGEGYKVERRYINSKGEVRNITSEDYILSEEYLGSLAEKPGLTPAGSLTDFTMAVFRALIGRAVEDLTTSASSAEHTVSSEQEERYGSSQTLALAGVGLAGSLRAAGLVSPIGGAAGTGATKGTLLVEGVIKRGAVSFDYTAGGATQTKTFFANKGNIILTNEEGDIFVQQGASKIEADSAATVISPEATGTGLETVGPGGTTVPTEAGGFGSWGWGSTFLYAAAAAIAGYFVGQLIGKQFGLSPGQTASWSYSLAGGGAGIFLGAKIGAAFFTSGLIGAGIGGVVGAAVGYIIAYYTAGSEEKYYIMSFECKTWDPVIEGDCSLCNDDIRPCSEYRCKSIGLNCQYFNDNGEPGYCAEIDDTGSATISPWYEPLTIGHDYTEITERSFKVVQTDEEELEAWNSVTFGIETNKPADCKIDTNHTSSYEEMKYDFIKEDYTHFKITVSPYANGSSSTPSMQEGDNNYYIRCKNFAGIENAAEFVVKIKLKKGEDLTPPNIIRFEPVSGSYSAMGKTNKSISMYVNEPAECKYSKDVDLLYAQMPFTMNCVNSGSEAYLGEWACLTTLENLMPGENKFYFKCQDMPNTDERTSTRRNTNEVSKEYVINVCGTGLNITSLGPYGEIISGSSPVEINLEATTSGCLNNATCYYREANNLFGSQFIKFFETEASIHKQLLTTVLSGDYDIEVKCEDEAGNVALNTTNFTVVIDDIPPQIIRAYTLNDKIKIMTDEEAICAYSKIAETGCEYEIGGVNNSIMNGDGTKIHTTDLELNEEYYIRCKDRYNNTNIGCGIILKTI